MTVYADVLLVINLFVNYILLQCSARIMKSSASRLRILLGAAIGSVYGLVIFLPKLPSFAELALRLAVTGVIVIATFGISTLRKFLRCYFTFFAVSMVFGGIMLALWLTAAPVGMVYSNGVVYFDINLTVLAVSTVVCFGIVSFVSSIIERRAPRESSAQVTVAVEGRTVTLRALIDTGNSLHEGFSGYPVAVAERKELKGVLPAAVEDYLDGKELNTDSTDFRLVFHKTVSGVGTLPAFKPNYMEIKTISGTVKTQRVYIAVTNNNLAGGEYAMLLCPELLEEDKCNETNFKKNQRAFAEI